MRNTLLVVLFLTTAWAFNGAYQTALAGDTATEDTKSFNQWTTLQNDFQRSGLSYPGVAADSCGLSKIWSYVHPDKEAGSAGPIIKDGKIVQAFDDVYIVFDLATGAVLDQLGPFGTGILCTPTIAPVTIGGVPTEVLFLSGGTDGMVYAYDWSNLSAGPIWTFDPPGTAPCRWGNFILLNDGATDIVYVAQDNGRVYALDAATGLDYSGWGGVPFQVSGFSPTFGRSGATDGVATLFYASNDVGFGGDIYAVDAFTGQINWQLSATDGLQAQSMFGLAVSDEGFAGGIAVDAMYPTRLYVNSSVTGPWPADGVFYIIDAETGDIISAVQSNACRNTTPIVSMNQVIVPTRTNWTSPPIGGHLLSFRKYDPVYMWVYSSDEEDGAGGRYSTDGILAYTVHSEKHLYIIDESGRLGCINVDTGEEMFRRHVLQDRFMFDANAGGMGAMIADTVVFATSYGGLVTMANTTTDRPRLKLISDHFLTRLTLGDDIDIPVVIEDVYSNNGCATLDVTLTADLEPYGTMSPGWEVWGVDSFDAPDEGKIPAVPSFASDRLPFGYPGRTPGERAASAAPPFLVQTTWSNQAMPGETNDVILHVNQTVLTRGKHTFYVELQSNDPDYFLTNTSLHPEIEITLIYGCILDTTTLHFGVGGLNEQLVTNTGRLGTGRWHYGDPGHNGFLFEYEGEEYYQGSLLYGVSQKRLAMHTHIWSIEDGEYESLLPDPNPINGDCKPAPRTSIVVPDYTIDGYSYLPLTASAVYASFLDSVQLFVDGEGAWDWSLAKNPALGDYDADSTIGTYTYSHTVGVQDAPPYHNLEYLNSLTVQVLEIVARDGEEITDFGIGHFFDPDMGGLDGIQINRDVSSAWAYSLEEFNVFGSVKLPFGLGYEPIYNAVQFDGYSGFWSFDTYWDSAYYYMQVYDTGYHRLDDEDGDLETHFTLVHDHTLAQGDTLRLAVAHFRLSGVADGSDPSSPEIADMARIANKFAGFGRGDVNNDNNIDIGDLISVANYVFRGGPGAIPFAHLSDVTADGVTDVSDVLYLVSYYFYGGPPPRGDWEI